MPSFRLLAGKGTVIETFDADDEAEAIECARRLSLEFPRRSPLDDQWLRLERRNGHRWELFFAWRPPAPEATEEPQ
ncbi:hypothetical protein [Blastococcus sp. PRF04-17]|uniref:hypothetical protein n=1 Tax=Blastococcus sp. PRF04-17 TaxID=2933797 RepID=UPI001FF2CAF1|nr:hypothetical protein [Blastococcus sp. PRF04-17]UOY02466.1 hypothetical protein MVA48_03495 [Blastococcus sp. PRF04-17]